MTVYAKRSIDERRARLWGRGGPRPGGSTQGVDPRGSTRVGWGVRGCWGVVRASHQAKKSQDKTPGVFLHAAFDFDAPRPQNTVQK